MTYLIDTNIISEIRKGRRCHPSVAEWWGEITDDELFLSVLTLGEIRYGIENARRKDEPKARAIEAWLERLKSEFALRIVGIDRLVAEEWGKIREIRSIPPIDGLLAATAKTYGFTVVSRNSKDFENLGVEFLNPF